MKTYGRADTKGLIRPELANRALTAKKKAEKAKQRFKRGKARPATLKDDNGVRLIPNTPSGAILGPEGKS
jgi:hypothetical protein